MKPEEMSSKIDFKLVSEYLRTVGCCKICVLRFLKPNIDDFLDLEYSFKSVNIDAVNRFYIYRDEIINYRKESKTKLL